LVATLFDLLDTYITRDIPDYWLHSPEKYCLLDKLDSIHIQKLKDEVTGIEKQILSYWDSFLKNLDTVSANTIIWLLEDWFLAKALVLPIFSVFMFPETFSIPNHLCTSFVKVLQIQESTAILSRKQLIVSLNTY